MSETTVACPHCGHNIKGIVRVCPVCGGGITKDISDVEAKCPRCGCGLDKCDYNGHHIEKCPGCSGYWIHVQDFEALTSERNVYLDSSVRDDFVRKPLSPEEGYLPCACCGKRMNRLNFRKITGIIIDWCRDCGWWLDAGELESIRAFIASGGLEKAQDKEIDAVKTEVQDLEGRVDHLEFMQKILHRWNMKRIRYDGF